MIEDDRWWGEVKVGKAEKVAGRDGKEQGGEEVKAKKAKERKGERK